MDIGLYIQFARSLLAIDRARVLPERIHNGETGLDPSPSKIIRESIIIAFIQDPNPASSFFHCHCHVT